MNNLFDPKIEQASAEYLVLRDRPCNAQMKELAQGMWQSFSDFADPDFPQQFACNVHPRFWEMYLGVLLLERKFRLIPKKSSFGPDLHIQLDGVHLWIEATAPEEGIGDDAVPTILEHNGFMEFPGDRIILRFTSAVTKKVQKREDYIKKGVINPDDAFVIALNGGRIGLIHYEAEPLPAIIRSVYAAGDYLVTIDKNTKKIDQQGYQYRYQLTKQSGAPVSTNAFLNPSYSGISGIIYSHAALWDIPATPGSEFLYIDNFFADTHLKKDWLGIGKYCYWEEDRLIINTLP